MKHIYTIFGILCLLHVLPAQNCQFGDPVPVPDDRSIRAIQREVNLQSSSEKVLCAVQLSFEHEYAEELRFELVSPTGKRLTLINGHTASSHTKNSTWDIRFVRHEEQARPDPFQKMFWGENNWSPEREYTGSYYPEDPDGLEVFDGEKSFGMWSLIYQDLVKGAAGRLIDFQLVFCDSKTTCHSCDLSADFITDEPARSYCGGDENLRQISPTLLESNLQPGFDYLFLVYDSLNNIVDHGKSIDLSEKPAGQYIISGIQTRPENQYLIEEAQSHSEIMELLDKIHPNICGILSSNTLEINILSDIEPQVDTMEIYGRDFIVFEGEVIERDTQMIIQSTDENQCSITRQVHIFFKNYETRFVQSNLYDCDHTSITLFTQNSMNFPVYRWFTRDGIISNQSKTNTDEIIVEAPGTYYVIFEIDDYLDTLSHTIQTNPSTPVFLLENEYTLCYNDTLQLPIGENYDKVEIEETPNALISDGILKVHQPGLYSLKLHKDDCIIKKNVLVIPPSDSDEIRLPDEQLTCKTNLIHIEPILDHSYDHYEWYFQNKKLENQKSIEISEPGYYTLHAYNTGDCGVTATLWVEDRTQPFDLNISGPDLLHCQNIHSDNLLKIQDPGPYRSWWTAPDGSQSEGTSIPATSEGIYKIEVEDEEGCIHTAEKHVSIDTVGFTLTAPDEFIIPCAEEEDHRIKIDINPAFREYNIEWKGAQKEGTGLFAIPDKPGEVQVTVTNRVNHCTETKSIQVSDHPAKPKFTLGPESRTITCDNPIREVSFHYENCEECEVIYNSHSDGISIDPELNKIIATEAGTVEISLTNQEGCQHTEVIHFSENKKATPLDTQIQHIGCEGRSGTIRIKNEEIYSQIRLLQGNEDIGLNTQFSDPASLKAIYTDRVNGCVDSAYFDIQVNDTPPKIDYDAITYLNCHSGEATLSVNASEKVNITWKAPSGETFREDEITIREPGNYTVYAENENWCTTTGSIEVIEDKNPPDISLKESYEIPCSSSTEGFSISYDTARLARAQWYGSRGWTSTEFFPDLPFAGEYRLMVTGKNGCSTTEVVRLKEESFDQIPAITGSQITCADPSSTVRLDDYTDLSEILWIDENGHSSRGEEFEVFNPGTIKASIKNNSGCRTTVQYQLEQDIETVPFDINRPIIDCANPTPEMRVKISEEYITRENVSYTWYQDEEYFSDDSQIKVDRPGNYKVIVENYNGCRDSLSYSVRIDTIKPNVRMIPDTINCRRSKIQLPSEIKTNNISKAVWRGPENFHSEEIRPGFTIPGMYTVIFTGTNGCTQQENFHIFNDTKSPVIDSLDFVSLGCNGATVPLQFHTKDEFTEQYWLLPDQSIHEESIVQIDDPGQYILYLQSANYCTTIDTLMIDEQILPEFDIEIADVNCIESTGSAMVIPQREDFTVSWSSADSTIFSDGLLSPPLPPGNYIVTVTDPKNQCDSTWNFDITDLSEIMEVEIMIDDSLRCERNEANLISSVYPYSDNYIYEWKINNRNHILSRDSIATGIIEQGWYTLTVKDTFTHCTKTDTFHNIRAQSTLRGFDMSVTEPACHIDQPGRAIIHQVKGALDDDQISFSLNESSFHKKDTFAALYANTPYTIRAKDQYGCQIDTMLFLELRGIMDKIEGIKDTVINKGDVINLNDPAFKITYSSADDPMNEKYEWIFQPDAYTCDFSCNEEVNALFHETRFGTAILTNEYGCTMEDTFYVYVAESEVINIPTGIIPASPKKENAHACIYTNEYISNIKLYVVFDLQGSIIFRRSNFDPSDDTDFLNCWNGRDQHGQILPQGNYTYYVQYETVYGATKEKYGNFFLLR